MSSQEESSSLKVQLSSVQEGVARAELLVKEVDTQAKVGVVEGEAQWHHFRVLKLTSEMGRAKASAIDCFRLSDEFVLITTSYYDCGLNKMKSRVAAYFPTLNIFSFLPDDHTESSVGGGVDQDTNDDAMS